VTARSLLREIAPRVKHGTGVATTRRKFLIGTGVIIAGGAVLYRAVGRFGPAATGYKVFDEDELAVLSAATEAYFPGPPEWPLSGKEAGCIEFVDRYVGNLYWDNQLLIRALLRSLSVSTLVSHRKTFRWLSVQERADVLDAWAGSTSRLRRGGHQSLALFIKMGYFENERVREAMGYTLGCNVPQEGRPQGV
jgi:hypothetical protein